MRSRPLYVISIVSEMVGLHPQTIRQYERLGLLKPSRTDGNTRRYSDEDIERLQFIVSLTKERGVNIAGVEIILSMQDEILKLERSLELIESWSFVDGDRRER